MGSTSSQRSTFAQSAFVYAITLAALTLLCAVLAYWTWIWLAPRTAQRGSPWRASTRPRCANALQRLDPLWDELFPAEQARIVQLLVERVDVSPDGADIRLRTEGLTNLVADLRAVRQDTRRAA